MPLPPFGDILDIRSEIMEPHGLLDMIDIQRELLFFEKSYWRALSDYQQHSAALEALCGGNLP